MIFTIEPMVNMGSDEIYTDEIDDWTVRTEDGLHRHSGDHGPCYRNRT